MHTARSGGAAESRRKVFGLSSAGGMSVLLFVSVHLWRSCPRCCFSLTKASTAVVRHPDSADMYFVFSAAELAREAQAVLGRGQAVAKRRLGLSSV